jgi:hypothetical protein
MAMFLCVVSELVNRNEEAVERGFQVDRGFGDAGFLVKRGS